MTIDVHKVDAFSSNVYHLSQQKGSRLAGLVRNEIQKGEKDSYDSYGVNDIAREKVGRNSNVEYSDMDHQRRWVSTVKIYDAKLVDKTDKLEMIHDPENEYAKAMNMALGRKMDKVIIAAAFAPAYVGKEGGATVSFPNSQTIVAHDGTTTTGVGLNSKTLRAIRKLFAKNEAIEDGANIKAVVTAEEIDAMLADDKIINSDYAVVKALAAGLVTDYMGFNFTRTELLERPSGDVSYDVATGAITGTGTVTAAKGRECIFFSMEGLLFAKAESLATRVTELPEKHYSTQIYASMDIGAVRMEEAKVVKCVTSEL